MRILLISLMLSLAGCESIAVMSTPKKNPVISNTALSARAESHFWKGLHKGDYASISETELITAPTTGGFPSLKQSSPSSLISTFELAL